MDDRTDLPPLDLHETVVSSEEVTVSCGNMLACNLMLKT